MLVRGRRIAWVGDDPSEAPGGEAEVVDLAGTMVQPSFVNAHVHLTALGLRLGGPDLSITTSPADVIATLAAVAPITPTRVILGAGWDETEWREQRAPTADEISAAVPDRPVMLTRADGHAVVVDRTSLAALPLARARGVERGADGQPTGLLRKEAATMAMRWFIGELPQTALHDARDLAASHLVRSGVGSAHEMGGPHRGGPDDFDAWREGDWPLEVVSYWGAFDLDFVIERGLRRVGGSLLLDGTVGSHSAALEEPYADIAGSGQLYRDTDELIAFVRRATALGVQVGLHAIGDRAVRQAVTAFRTTAEQLGYEEVRRARHRLEHGLLIPPDHIAQLAAMGVNVVVQPTAEHGLTSRGGAYEQRLGHARAREAHPLSALAAAGVGLAFGDDGEHALDPWAAMSAAMSRDDGGRGLSADQALRAATLGGRAAARQQSVGPLKTGYRADLAAFEPRSGDRSPRCVLTMVAGRIVT